MIKFLIDHIDPLGQGVFKQGDDIFFVPKTLPGEEGFLKVLKKSKGVHFCEVIELTKVSPLRIKSDCEHFKTCNGCNFLHTNYQEELNFKINSFQKLLSGIEALGSEIEIIKSPKRLGYRNRIQMHYHNKSNSLGFKGYKSSKIISTPNCKIMNDVIKAEYEEVKKSWKKQVKNEKPFGHIEIYEREGIVQTNWNKGYAEGGFSQVNQVVNKELQLLVSRFIDKNHTVLDLFGGDGNLTKNIECHSKLSVDLYPDGINKDGKFHLNLFEDDSLDKFKDSNTEKYDIFVVDPPRSGFKMLKNWTEYYMPNKIIYVSCHPATMTRDIKEITKDYQVVSSTLIDLFPATYHYEAMILLERRSNP